MMHDNVILNDHKAENFHWTKKFAKKPRYPNFHQCGNFKKVTIMTRSQATDSPIDTAGYGPSLN